MDVFDALDITEGEKKVYKALIKLKETTTGPLYKEAQVSQSKVYEILDRLKKKGLASNIDKNGTSYWYPANPHLYLEKVSKDLDIMKKKKEILEQEMPNLFINVTQTQEDKIEVFQEYNGFKNLMWDAMESFSKDDDLLIFGTPNPVPDQYKRLLLQWDKERTRRGFSEKVIYSENMKEFGTIFHKEKGSEIRFTKIKMPATISICPDRVIIMNWKIENPKFIVMYGESIVENFRAFFESFWEMSS